MNRFKLNRCVPALHLLLLNQVGQMVEIFVDGCKIFTLAPVAPGRAGYRFCTLTLAAPCRAGGRFCTLFMLHHVEQIVDFVP